LAVAVSAQKPADTVFLEDLTWEELRDMIRSGTTTVIIATAGTEQKGPHMVIGEHKFVITHTSEKIARALGNAVVAPVITYVPEGSWETPRGHMAKAGTITLPNDRFMVLLEHAAKSLRKSGFKDIILIGDSGGNQSGMRDVAAKLNEEWKGTGARAHFIGDYYTKSSADTHKYIVEKLGVPESDIGSHAGMVDTSELMFVNPSLIRMNKRAPGGGSPTSGVSGDPTKATAELGAAIIKIKIDNALAQIKTSMAAAPAPSLREDKP
jgi:creatinine amidohydrolase/Fe(II)-dependent formamide hydrolase-like protein